MQPGEGPLDHLTAGQDGSASSSWHGRDTYQIPSCGLLLRGGSRHSMTRFALRGRPVGRSKMLRPDPDLHRGHLWTWDDVPATASNRLERSWKTQVAALRAATLAQHPADPPALLPRRRRGPHLAARSVPLSGEPGARWRVSAIVERCQIGRRMRSQVPFDVHDDSRRTLINGDRASPMALPPRLALPGSREAGCGLPQWRRGHQE